MEPVVAKSFPVALDQPQKAQLGHDPEQRGWGRWAFLATVALVVTGSFAWGVYQARHSPRDLAFVIVTYDLVAVLCCCLAKQIVLRRDDPEAAPERRRVRIVVRVVSLALAVIIAARVSFAMPDLRLRIAVLVISGVGVGLSFYFFAREDAGRQTDNEPLLKASPERRV
uniref:Uncharacterized protein n=1 Tax=Avena sativa TaxID=4498 RepID=A0ACD5VUG7_AVESA